MHAQPGTRTVNIGIIGLGTVGGGVVRMLAANRDEYLRAYGLDLHIARACARHPERAEELGLAADVSTTDWREVAHDEAVDIVVELIGGDHPATEIMTEAFKRGKHVVSANKALLAANMEALATEARAAGVQLRCEASCAGGIPIIDALERGLAGNDMRAIAGIMNGTTNYILSRMDAEGLGFDEVLADAQRLGYAEADPTADVDGLDAGAKLAILSSIAFHTRVTSSDVTCQGIRAVSATDIAWAREHGMRIKLLGVGTRTAAGIEARVHPALIPATHMLAGVNGAMNAVYAVGDAVGETMFYGAGAGSLPTASAVMADILAIATPLAHGLDVAAEAAPFERRFAIAPAGEQESRFYMRVDLTERTIAESGSVEDAADDVRHALAEDGLPMSPEFCTVGHEAIYTTGIVTTAALYEALEHAGALNMIERAASIIRIEDTDAWSAA